MQIKIKVATLILMIVSLMIFLNCEKDKKEDLAPLLALVALTPLTSATQQATDLPQPPLNTASMKLGTVQYTLTDLQDCKLGIGNVGIVIGQLPNVLPVLNLHSIDPTKTTVTIGAGGSQMDIDKAAGVVYMAGKNKVAGNCSATVKENTATVYDLQAIDCPVTDELGGNAPDTTVSFRVRCTKQ
ncbi:hypothetical protein [Leptospira adleri]|uniref:Uncharacterized protein n=1 Tax=Leptospira adleri TaxID=2023186 RepID=A0A2M9YNF0_9LEPT|nr:hypothetical protein [Leptospira adleri]PJZ53053.1 hypothetical protein CH380_11580 [Leptospira adleri]PJZ62609.1 hypothetical protein CH376_07360 [Leptospira adleri]TGM61609.1 hypothetical protein EHQ97_01220 [Leptospira adleri]